MTLIFNCIGQSLMRSDNNIIAENNCNYLFARFDLDESWNGLAVTACFKSKSIPKPIHEVLIDGKCDVPWEVIKAGEFRVSLFGAIGDDDSLIRATSTEVKVRVESGPSLTGQNSAKPTPTDVQQITNLAQSAVNTANSVREDADNGLFDGEDGKDGASFEVFKTKDELDSYPSTTTADRVRFIWGGEDYVYNAVTLRKYGVYDAEIFNGRLIRFKEVIILSGGGSGGITIDEKLSETSKNPVENRAITAKFSEIDTTVGNIDALLKTI